jgi:beta-phosphoglucomutase
MNSPLDNLKNIVFDLDGVLLDSEPQHQEAKRLALQHFHLQVTDEFYEQAKGRTDDDFFRRILAMYPTCKADHAELMQLKRDNYKALSSKLKPIDGAMDFVRMAFDKSIRLAVCTSSDKFYQTIAFEVLGIDKYLTAVVNADLVKKHKPDPEPYLKSKELLGSTFADSFVIEDSLSGVRSADAADYFVVGLETSFSDAELKSAGADLTVKTYRDLIKKLDW